MCVIGLGRVFRAVPRPPSTLYKVEPGRRSQLSAQPPKVHDDKVLVGLGVVDRRRQPGAAWNGVERQGRAGKVGGAANDTPPLRHAKPRLSLCPPGLHIQWRTSLGPGLGLSSLSF